MLRLVSWNNWVKVSSKFIVRQTDILPDVETDNLNHNRYAREEYDGRKSGPEKCL